MNIGLIGNDTSHVEIFSGILHDDTHPYYMEHAKIVGFIEAYSENLEISASRAQRYKEILLERGIPLYHSVDELAKKVDGWMICTVDGSNHCKWFDAVGSYRKPVFIDKPITIGIENVQAIISKAQKYRTPIFSASSLRYSEALRNANGKTINKIYAYGPLPMQKSMPGYYWYGIHTLEWIEALVNAELVSVEVKATLQGELLFMSFDNGCHVVFDGDYFWHDRFGGTIFTESDVISIRMWETEKPYYVSLLEQIILFMETKQSPLHYHRIEKVMKWIEMINAERDRALTERL